MEPFLLPPKIFGCVCFVYTLGPSHDKLSPRSIRCIFLDYSYSKKSYRCYDPSQRRLYVFADVTFFETTPYFSKHPVPSDTLSHNIPLLSLLPLVDDDASEDRPQKPVQVYTRCNKEQGVDQPLPLSTSVGDPPSSDVQSAPISTHLFFDLHLPIAVRKENRTSTTHLIVDTVSYDHLRSSFHTFALSLSSVGSPNNY